MTSLSESDKHLASPLEEDEVENVLLQEQHDGYGICSVDVTGTCFAFA